jgi:hypothetical protein
MAYIVKGMRTLRIKRKLLNDRGMKTPKEALSVKDVTGSL